MLRLVRVINLFILLSLFLAPVSCKSVDVYVVPDLDYKNASYSERMKYLARLYNANELNKKNIKQKRFIILE